MATTLVIEGATKLQAKLARAPAVIMPVLAAALYTIGNELLASALRITPIDTGNLRSTGQVTEPAVQGLGVEVDVGFGGAAADYAIYVHEDMEAQHNSPTQAKFLEAPALALAPEFGPKLAAVIGPAIAGA